MLGIMNGWREEGKKERCWKGGGMDYALTSSIFFFRITNSPIADVFVVWANCDGQIRGFILEKVNNRVGTTLREPKTSLVPPGLLFICVLIGPGTRSHVTLDMT